MNISPSYTRMVLQRIKEKAERGEYKICNRCGYEGEEVYNGCCQGCREREQEQERDCID